MQINVVNMIMPAVTETKQSTKMPEDSSKRSFENVLQEQKQNQRENSSENTVDKDVKKEQQADKIKDNPNNEQKTEKTTDSSEKEQKVGQEPEKEVKTTATTNSGEVKADVKAEGKEEKTDKEKEADKVETKSLEEIINSIAQLLGVQPEEVAKILQSANAESLKGSDVKNKAILEKLSALVGTDKQDKTKVLQELKDLVKDLNTKADTKKGGTNVELGKKIEETQVQTTEPTQVKQKEEIKQDNKVKNKTVDTDNANSELKTDQVGKVQDEKKIQSEAKDQKEQGSWTEKVKVIVHNKTNSENFFKLPTENNLQNTQNLVQTQTVEKPQLKMSELIRPQRNEVLKQIVDKASVTLTPDKAEMVLNLKPDHLGKLEMKLSTEKGILAAQIVTENQQVKQIIESNFNVLRDALEKQGISVQQFSVSVGNENQNRNFQNSAWRNGKTGSAKTNKNVSSAINSFAYNNDNISRNRIAWPDSTINFTA